MGKKGGWGGGGVGGWGGGGWEGGGHMPSDPLIAVWHSEITVSGARLTAECAWHVRKFWMIAGVGEKSAG